jgi:hypothetical protein
MVKLLRQLIRRLSETISAWDEFENHEIGYFLYDGESPTTSSSLKFSLGAVNKAFSDLKDILRKLRYLERELCKDNPQGVSHPFFSKFKKKLTILIYLRDMEAN